MAAAVSRTDGGVDARLERYATFLPKEEWRAVRAWSSRFFDFQKDWIFDDSNLAVMNKSRQIGTSFSTAAVGTVWGAFHGELTTIISIGQEESDVVLDKARRHAQVLEALGSKMARMVRSNANEIVFASGGSIHALPSTGGRSFTGNVFLDEFAYQQHAKKVWDAAAPVALLGDYRMRVVSTPNGIGNEFSNLVELAREGGGLITKEMLSTMDASPELAQRLLKAMADPRYRWKLHEVTIEDAIAQKYPVDIAKCWALAQGDPRLFKQMFMCSFLDTVLQYISTDLINQCTSTENLLKYAKDAGATFFAGLDIGREVDLSCLCVVARILGRCYVVHIETMKRTDGEGLEAMVDRAFELYNIERLVIDETGLGVFPAERIKKKHSELIDVPHRRPRVEPLPFTPNNKALFVTGLHSAMTQSQLVLPANDNALPKLVINDADGTPHLVNEPGTAEKLRKEIASIQRVVTDAANVQYRTPRTKDGHGDRAWALMLAMHARSQVNAMLDALQASLGKTGTYG